MSSNRCPLCTDAISTHLDERRIGGEPVLRCRCRRCGEFWSLAVEWSMCGDEYRKRLYKLSSLCREQNLARLPPFFLQFRRTHKSYPLVDGTYPIMVDELLSRWPKSVVETIDRIFVNLARTEPTPGMITKLDNMDYALLFASGEGQAAYYIRSLGAHREWFEEGSGTYSYRLTPRGWQHFDSLTRGNAQNHNPAFVAMWFDSNREFNVVDMNDVYRLALSAGISDAGYRAVRVDLTEKSNDGVVDEIIALIRAAPFVIADFTGNRHGVYFEAGFGRGLGRPVIHCCHRSHFAGAHFDVKHLNTIIWDGVDELRARVANRILGSIGRGPFSTDELS